MTVRAVSGRVNRTASKPLPDATKVRGYSVPPPLSGWNARDSLAGMEETDAIILDNWFPGQSTVTVRNGFESWATGLGTAVESLMSWSGPSSGKLFAAVATDIYEVTASGAVGAAAQSSLTNGRWQHTMFGTSAGAYLYMVNGADAPRHYDGTTWVEPVISGAGLTVTDLIHVNSYKHRLFFVEEGSLSFWYLDVDNIAGTLTEFDLSALCSRGGHLVAMGTWTRVDTSSGIAEIAAFVTSEGQVLLFSGADPSDTSDWAHIGTFNIGAPIGRRCFAKMGSELVVITEDGYSSLARFLAAGRSSDKAALSDKIIGAVKAAVATSRDVFGWQPVFYPAGGMIFVNVPFGSTAHQHVSNSTTGAWCRFTGQNSFCWEVHDNELYFGGVGVVYKADTGLSDNNADIATDAKQAFSYFGSRGVQKRFAMVRPKLEVDGAITVALAVNVDFSNEIPVGSPSFAELGGAEWDVATWDVDEWGESGHIAKEWQTVTGMGFTAAIRMRTASKNGSLTWHATDWLIERAAGPGYL